MSKQPERGASNSCASIPSSRGNAEDRSQPFVSVLPQDVTALIPDGTSSSLHELRLRQFELETQVEELLRTRAELIASRSLYIDLYDLAPIGCLTIDELGLILDANLTASQLLGVTRDSLAHRPISNFIASVDKGVFDRHRKLLTGSGDRQTCELRMIKNDGAQIWVRLISKIGTNSDGTVVSHIAIYDVTEIKQAEIARLESEVRFHHVIEATQDGIWDWHIETGHVYFSPQWARLLGYEPDEIKPHVDSFYAFLHPDHREQIEQQLDEHFSGLIREKHSEIRLRTKSGEYRWFLDRGKVVARDAVGKPSRMVGTITDIEDRKRADKSRAEVEARLLEREARLRNAQAISKIGNFHWDAATDKVEWSDELYRIYGRDAATFVPSFASYVEAIHPDDCSMVMQSLQKAMESLGEFDHEYRAVRSDGVLIWVHAVGGAIASVDGSLIGLEGTCQDITERKKADEAGQEARQRLQKIAGRVPGVFYEFRLRPDGSTCFPYASSAIRDMFGVEAKDLTEDGATIFATILHEDFDRLMNSIYESAESLAPWQLEFRIRLSDGNEKWIWGSSLPVRHPDGGTLWHGVLMDISERRKVEEALRWNQSLLQMTSDSSPLAFMVVDNRTDGILYFNTRCCEIWGIEHLADRIRSGELNNQAIIPYCLPVLADVPAFAASCEPLQDVSNRVVVEDEIAFKDGRTIRRFSTQIRDEEDRYHGRFYMFEDITARKQAEAERESLHAQLRESQKMEAVGTLAGGIAHDFNNILAVILGNAEIAGLAVNENPALKMCLDEIRKASIRARDLVLQILSFSRQQPTEFKLISLVSVVHESVGLLKATLPARIKLNVECDADLPNILGDATQLEQVIINLATNSMQAIGSETGQITVRLDSVELDSVLAETNTALRAMHDGVQRDVLRLVVSDDGPGMNAATVSRIFEPFFTTKPVGKGTGLGLAVVHGIIKTHNGSIVVESSESNGASFTIYLLPAPSLSETENHESKSSQQSTAPVTVQGRATDYCILVVDDSREVLAVIEAMLKARGYRVKAFTVQQEAVDAVNLDPFAFDLVLTDYNMPGMSGLEVSRQIQKLRPGLPVLVASGFVDDELRLNAAQAGVRGLISKPLDLNELCAEVELLCK